MSFDDSQILTIVVSPLFVVSAIQLVRRYIPGLKGHWILLIGFVLSEVLAIGERLLTQPDQWHHGLLAGLLLTVLALGGNDKMNRFADRAAGRKEKP